MTGYEMLERAQVLLDYAPEWAPVSMEGLALSDPMVTAAYQRACQRRDDCEQEGDLEGQHGDQQEGNEDNR